MWGGCQMKAGYEASGRITGGFWMWALQDAVGWRVEGLEVSFCFGMGTLWFFGHLFLTSALHSSSAMPLLL